MVFYPGGPRIPGRWYFVDPKLPFYPGGDIFGSSRWFPTAGYGGSFQGEIRPAGDVWVNGAPPPVNCGVSEGGPDAWHGHASPLSPVYKWCCGWFLNAGVAAEASAAFGSITVQLAAQGTAAEAETATGSIAIVDQVVGTAAEAETATGSIAIVDQVVGVAAEAETATGSIAIVDQVVGTAAEAETATGSIAIVDQVVGTAAEAETATGSIAIVDQVVGVAAEAETATGSIAIVDQVVGVAAEAETATGSIAIVDQVLGVAAEAETATGDLTFVPGFVNPVITSCYNCPGGTYTYWLFTVTGITGSSDCTDQNVSHVLANSPGTCTWFDTHTHPGTTTDLSEFALITPTVASLYFIDSVGNVQAQYTTTSWSCLGPTNTLTLVGSPSCSSWPGTITLTSS